jgi:RNA polymerase sigma-70 factor (ECF subfamily)
VIRLGFRPARAFPSTDWRLVLASRRPGTEYRRESIAELCAIYWYPVYAFLRRRSHRAEEAEDLTQGFFAHILDNGLLTRAEPEKGRLRSLLLTSLNNFVANEHHRRSALKRRAAPAVTRAEMVDAEARYAREPVDTVTPERLYERQWAATLLTHVLDTLRDEFARAGKAHLFDLLKGHLVGEKDEDAYRDAAAALDTSVGALRVAAHRLRRRYREMLRAEIARTVDGSDREIDDEIRYLFNVTQP